MRPITIYPEPGAIPLPTATVLSEQTKAVAFIIIELAAARQLTGWRRAGILTIAGLNVVRMIRTGRAVHRVLEQRRAEAGED